MHFAGHKSDDFDVENLLWVSLSCAERQGCSFPRVDSFQQLH